MKDYIICICITLYTIVISALWYNKGCEDTIEDINSNFPSAMDVYNGKTALQYTIVDGNKIDSIVVFKK